MSRLRGVCAAMACIVAGCRVAGTTAIAPPVEGAADAATDRDTSAVAALDDLAGDAASREPTPSAADGGATRDASSVPASTCKSLATCEAPSGCTSGEYGPHVYFICTDSLTWDDARARCMAAGTDLAIIDDVDENAFVAGALAAPSWIGLNDRDTEGDYRWIPPGSSSSFGSSASFTNWADAVPDNCGAGLFGEQDCVRIAVDGTWNDSACAGGCTEGTFAFVCESL